MDKKDIAEWLQVFENNKFCYIENMVWVMVNEESLETSNQLKDFTMDYIHREPGVPIGCSHRTLLMFRKMPSSKLELRHQRTCDVVFDAKFPKDYVYHLIETLLPEAGVMLELWADAETSRENWIHVVEN